MEMNKILALGALALALSATSARAGAYGETEQTEEAPAAASAEMKVEETEEEFGRTGPYIGVGGLYAFELFDQHGGSGANVANSGGFHVRAGWRFHPNVAVEALYEWFHEFDVDPDGHYDGWALTLNGKVFALFGRFQPYALIGAGYMDIARHSLAGSTAQSGDDFTLRFGGGLETAITEHISIGPEVAYLCPFANADDVDMVTLALGLRYTF
jgi:opacity protein-like surface antigen